MIHTITHTITETTDIMATTDITTTIMEIVTIARTEVQTLIEEDTV